MCDPHLVLSLARQILAHPLTRGLQLDAPETTALRRSIILNKGFLQLTYREWYGLIVEALPVPGSGAFLEVGSGGGFLQEYVPGLITSEVFYLPETGLVADGQRLPFQGAALAAIVMTNVLHHMPCARDFLRESARCLCPGGRVVMIEPWLTPWSHLVYRNLHHEPFRPEADDWHFPPLGPLSAANGALPWIIFERDKAKFEAEFPALRIVEILPFMPFRYLLSGGVSHRTLMPEWAFGFWRWLERALGPWRHSLAMFARIVLERVDESRL